MTPLRKLQERHRLILLDRGMRRSDPALEAEFSRSLRPRRGLHGDYRSLRICAASLVICWGAGVGVALGMSAGIAVGAVVAAAMALVPVRYLTRRPVIRERELEISTPSR